MMEQNGQLIYETDEQEIIQPSFSGKNTSKAKKEKTINFLFIFHTHFLKYKMNFRWNEQIQPHQQIADVAQIALQLCLNLRLTRQ